VGEAIRHTDITLPVCLECPKATRDKRERWKAMRINKTNEQAKIIDQSNANSPTNTETQSFSLTMLLGCDDGFRMRRNVKQREIEILRQEMDGQFEQTWYYLTARRFGRLRFDAWNWLANNKY
jgi:hypothetical protein